MEEILLAKLQTLGYHHTTDAEIGPDGSAPKRESYGDVLLLPRLRAAVSRLNAALPEEARENAIRKLIQTECPSLLEENRRLANLVESRTGAPEVGGR